MTRSAAQRLKHAEEHGVYVRLSGKAVAGLERLKDAYGMSRRMEVITYLIEQGVKGLEAAREGEAA